MYALKRTRLLKLSRLMAVKKALFGLNMFIWVKIYSFKLIILFYTNKSNRIINKLAGAAAASIGIYFSIKDNFTEIIEKIEDTSIDFNWVYIYIGADIMFWIGCIVSVAGLLGAIAIIKENHFLLFVVTEKFLTVQFFHSMY
jgi:hypothetical protein